MAEQSEQILDLMTEIILQYINVHRDEESHEHIEVREEEK